jgi:hypothetical protein
VDAVEVIRASGARVERGLDDEAIEALAAEVGTPFSAELREVLRVAASIDGPVEIDFTGRSLSFGDDELFPACHAIAGDGFGNHWIVDLTPDAPQRAPVFFACHDPPVVVFEAPDVATFVQDALASGLGGDEHDGRVDRVWAADTRPLTHAEALAGDEALSAFASELDERFTFVDLRAPEQGDGFAWGRHGPRTIVRRDGTRRLFAYAAPERKRGFLSRLRG